MKARISIVVVMILIFMSGCTGKEVPQKPEVPAKDKEAIEKAGINYDEGVHRFSNNTVLYEKFLNKFLQDPTIAQAAEALKSGDNEQFLKTIHTLKGVAGNLSMNTLHKKCAFVVDNIRNGKLDSLSADFEEIKGLYSTVTEAIKT